MYKNAMQTQMWEGRIPMKKWRIFFSIILILLMILTPDVHAVESNSMGSYAGDDLKWGITLNGNPVAATASILDGVLYLPVRAISESLKYEVTWDTNQRKVGINGYGSSLMFGIEEGRLVSDEHAYNLAPNPILIKDRTYLGQDFFSENLALKVTWDMEKEQVHLTSIQENPWTIGNTSISTETKTLKTFIQYPVITGLTDENVQREINDVFKALAVSAVAEGKKNETELAPYVLRYPDMPGQCETYFDYRVKYNQKGYLSLVFQNYQYALGAHGSTVQTGYTINLETGQILALGDLFKVGSDYETLLSDAVKVQLIDRNLWDSLLVPFENVKGDHDYYLTNQGLVLYYQQYEILPGAAGIVEFPVGYSLIDEMLAI
jgi:inhibitor of cysteine peptidase